MTDESTTTTTTEPARLTVTSRPAADLPRRTRPDTSGLRVPGTQGTPGAPRAVPTGDDFSFAARRPRAVAAAASAAASDPAAPSASAAARLLWTATAVAVVVLSAFFVLIVSGRVVTEGPVVMVLTRTHGIHVGDLFALAGWGVAVLALVASAMTSSRAARR
ncbi:hypothetical protein SAMN06264364_10480 [Quadrisphaera granulorum]|uniref:Uncharacterized protein n=1 Tax=Quadrisphaera granulorum TaxID=317664 RepID=A0A316ACM3_9ACTN|nr:hypothetical protein [Quadrisphaera granulorum]PWJ55159.1 hypothetical protein BXY45_10480 [Quadrisphaera granulorum]SZE95668.1 hypothetical protein SAMN06264364_10480 [Quadrisphaera granulorum]